VRAPVSLDGARLAVLAKWPADPSPAASIRPGRARSSRCSVDASHHAAGNCTRRHLLLGAPLGVEHERSIEVLG
jgi:hypothetical protein